MTARAPAVNGGRKLRRRAATCAMVAIGLTGCADHQVVKNAPSDASDIRQMVAGAAERSLDQHGLFIVAAPSQVGDKPTIDQAQAVTLAGAYIRDMAPQIQPWLETKH